MKRLLRMWTPKQALAVLGLLRVWIVWYISAIPTWRKNIDYLLSIMQSTLWYIHRFLLVFSTWRLSLNVLPMYYGSVLYQSQPAYFSIEIHSCTFIFSSISQINLSLNILCYSWYLRWSQSLIRKRARRYFQFWRQSEDQPNSVVIQRILLLGYSWVGTTPSVEAKLFCCFLRQVDTWSRCILGQSVHECKFQLLGRYSSIH